MFSPPNPDPARILESFRSSYVNFHYLWRRGEAVPEGVELATPQEEPVDEDHVPDCARPLLDAWAKSHPRVELAFQKYMRVENGRPVKIIEGEAGLPEEGRLLTLSQTVSLVATGHVRIVTETVVARIGADR